MTPDDDLALPCRTCGAESTVHYASVSMQTGETDEYGLCADHAPTCTPADFMAREEG